MGSEKIKFNFVVAHSLEAKPIVDFYRLSKNVSCHAFDLFEGENVRLIVSGQGKVNSAAATGYCAGLNQLPGRPGLWVNVGIAGHESHSLGDLFRINKVTDAVTQKTIYPVSILRSANIKGAALTTVDVAQRHYTQDCLYDMEASAFFNTASRIESLEYVHGFKIISDNQDNPLEKFKPADVQALMESKIEVINEYLVRYENELIDNIDNETQSIDIKREIKNKYRLTYSQEKLISELIDSLVIQNIEQGNDLLDFDQAKELILYLEQQLSLVELTVA